MATALTARQSQILDLIRQTVIQTGFPPTRAEIAKELGFKSTNAAEDHLKALARKGFIVMTPGASRGIRLTQAADKSSSATSRVTSRIEQTVQEFVLPLVGRVAAGSPILAQENIDREISVDPGLFGTRPDYLLQVRGMSMRDIGILDGDLLAVKRSNEARDGSIVVARIGDDVTVKRLSREGKEIVLLPENPDFEPIRIGPGEDFALEGLAVGLIRTQSIH